MWNIKGLWKYDVLAEDYALECMKNYDLAQKNEVLEIEVKRYKQDLTEWRDACNRNFRARTELENERKQWENQLTEKNQEIEQLKKDLAETKRLKYFWDFDRAKWLPAEGSLKQIMTHVSFPLATSVDAPAKNDNG